MKRFNGIEADPEGVYYLRADIDRMIDRIYKSLNEIIITSDSHHEAINVARREHSAIGKDICNA